jgi:hypothetical protein
MTRINDVKKVLRNSGVEMDADDVVAMLVKHPRYQARVTRTQVAHSLQALCESDLDVIRTRTGMYQHVQLNAAPTPLVTAPTRRTLTLSTAQLPAPGQHASSTPAQSGDPMMIVVETSYFQGGLCDMMNAPPESVSVTAVAGYLAGLAELRLGCPACLSWGDSAAAAAAEVTRHQYRLGEVILIASIQIAQEAQRTAQRLGRPVRIWSVGTDPNGDAFPTRDGLAEIYQLNADDLLARCRPSASTPAGRLPTAEPPADRRRSVAHPPGPNIATRTRSGTTQDSLWHLDDNLYRRAIPGVTGRGNTHSLKRQALLIGETYAQRWWSVVNNESRDAVTTRSRQALEIPGRLYTDLLAFAELHGMHLHGSHEIKNHLRRGFWNHIRQDFTGDHAQARSA